MNKTELVNNMTRTFHKVGFQFKKHSPEILIGAGVIGGVTSAVMACKATLKVNEVVEETKETIDKIHEATEKGVNEAGSEYTLEDSKKDLTIVYAQTGVKFAKLYGPSIVLGGLSIASILTGHKILRTRYVATAAAYAAVDKSFKEYRGRVVERFGKELDKELRYNIKAQEVDEITVNEDGSETITKKTVQLTDPNVFSEYARVYDDGCAGWTKDPEHNMTFLIMQQNYANDKLKSRGHLLLNEVYDMLGIPRTKAGMVVGWIFDEKNPVGDNFVDFGIFDVNKPKNRDFVNGYERAIILDFNVDGNIYELMK